MDLKQGNKIENAFKNWGLEFLIEFDISLQRFTTTKDWTNILRLTNSTKDKFEYGDRMPTVHYDNDKQELKILVIDPSSQVHRFLYEMKSIDKTYHVKIESRKSLTGPRTKFCGTVDNITKCVDLDISEPIDNVNLFLSDTFKRSFGVQGSIFNVLIVNLHCEEGKF